MRADLEEQTVRQALLQASDILGTQRRTYSDIMVTPPTDRLPLAGFCRVKDIKTGLDIKANIISIDISMSVNTESQIGATELKLGLDELIA